MDTARHREILDEVMARTEEHDRQRSAEFRERLARAPQGWLPPPGKRHELNEEVLEKCLGITVEEWRALTGEQRLEVLFRWFPGKESLIPYEDWGLKRPAWL